MISAFSLGAEFVNLSADFVLFLAMCVLIGPLHEEFDATAGGAAVHLYRCWQTQKQLDYVADQFSGWALLNSRCAGVGEDGLAGQTILIARLSV